MTERRQSERVVTTQVYRLDVGERLGRVAVTRNRSDTGMLFATPSRLSVGDVLALSRTELDGRVLEARTARVVRVERGQSYSGVMRWLVAVAFEPAP